MKERIYRPTSGWGVLLLVVAAKIVAVAISIWAIGFSRMSETGCGWTVFASALFVLVGIFICCGFLAIAPNESRALLLFGEYRGTVMESGFFWVNPLYSKRRVSLRVRNFETGSVSLPEKKDATTGNVVQAKSRTSGRPSKVNDRDGNPIEISAVVVWKVVNTAEALFEVDDYQHFVEVQSEAALRNLASRYPYDCTEDNSVSLRGNTTEVCNELKKDIEMRLDKAGVDVVEARISHLAYAPEIAAAMLQRQQAQAIVAARTKIVEGAVGMVQMALDQLSNEKIVELDEERRATMVSNLLVVLCGDRNAQPVVNTGSLYQ